MKFNIGGAQYRLAFQYNDRETTCQILRLIDDTSYWRCVSVGLARRKPSDPISKAYGRTLALHRSLEYCSHEFRQAAWKAYRAAGAKECWHLPETVKTPTITQSEYDILMNIAAELIGKQAGELISSNGAKNYSVSQYGTGFMVSKELGAVRGS